MKGPKSLGIVIKLGEYAPRPGHDMRFQVESYTKLKYTRLTHRHTHTGTSSIVDEKTHQPLLSNLSLIVETAHKLREDGHRVVIVSSGAIGVGMRRMERDKRPKHVAQLQALAAIGQCRLMNIWDSLFSHLKQPVAQILLTRNDIADVSPFLLMPILSLDDI